MPKVGFLATIAFGKPIPPPRPAPPRPHRRLPPYTSPRSSHYRPLPPIEGSIHSLYSPTPFTADTIILNNPARLEQLRRQQNFKRDTRDHSSPSPALEPEPTTQLIETAEQHKLQVESVIRKRPREYPSTRTGAALESIDIENTRPVTKRPRVQTRLGAQYNPFLLQPNKVHIQSQTPQLKKPQTNGWEQSIPMVNRFNDSCTPAHFHDRETVPGYMRDIDEISHTPIAPPNCLQNAKPLLQTRLEPHNTTLQAAKELEIQSSAQSTGEAGIDQYRVTAGKISAPTETDTDLDYTGQMHLTKEPVRSTGHPSTGSFCPEHSYITPYNEVTGPRLLHATETLVQAIEQQQSIEEVEQAHPQPPVAIVPFQRIVKRRERKEPVQKRERAEKRKRERAENMETDFEVENYPVHQVTNALVPIPTQSRQIIATSERFYARQYAPKKVDVVVESMLPRFTMPPKTIQPETLLLQAREKERIKRAEINTLRVNVAEMKEQHLDNERLSARASRAANRLNRQAASISSANSRGQQFAHRVRTSRHPTPLGHMESAESSSSTHESEVYQSKLSTSEDGLRSESIDTILQPRPAFSEDYLEPYKSTYFFPQLDDYGPPQPVVYWHMENQMHPSVPNRATPKVGSVTGLVDLLPKTETTKPTVSSNFEGLDPELAELLKPMTDDEDDTQDVVDSDEESGDDRAQEPCIVKFPLDAPIRQVKEYSELKQALKEGLAQRNQVYERLENGVEVMKRGLKQQELFEKREKWGERSHPTRPTGTKSRATAVVENTDFLDWLRAKAGEE